ncbi:MAG: single-stranded DNA-binding protein [Prevotellaceae bacterium]|nr:single-stranded DNA-binding protein [Prevotellaceae bacterium]
MSINKVILLGNAGQDPKVTYYEGGNCVAQLSLATTERGYTLQNGTQVPDRTEWHNLVFRGRTAEVVEQYVHKGDKLYIEGKIRTRSYDDQSGIKRYVTEIFVDTMEMLTPKTNAPRTPQPQQPVRQQGAPAQQGTRQRMQGVQPGASPAPSASVQENPVDDLPF